MRPGLKPIAFCGDSLSELRAFPGVARQEGGVQLDRVRRGGDACNGKPTAPMCRGVREIRIHDEAGIYRLIYIATFAEAVYVLHAFQKKTQRTMKRDVDLAASRLRDLVRRAR